MRKALLPVLARAGYPAKDIDIKGPQLGLRFVLKHREHENALARDFVENVMDARREPGGGWLDLTIASPTGDSITVYLARDASHAQRRTAWHLVRSSAPGLTFAVAKAASAVVHQWKEIATCRYLADTDSTEVEWKTDAINTLNLDIEKIRQEFAAMVRRGPTQARG